MKKKCERENQIGAFRLGFPERPLCRNNILRTERWKRARKIRDCRESSQQRQRPGQRNWGRKRVGKLELKESLCNCINEKRGWLVGIEDREATRALQFLLQILNCILYALKKQQWKHSLVRNTDHWTSDFNPCHKCEAKGPKECCESTEEGHLIQSPLGPLQLRSYAAFSIYLPI